MAAPSHPGLLRDSPGRGLDALAALTDVCALRASESLTPALSSVLGDLMDSGFLRHLQGIRGSKDGARSDPWGGRAVGRGRRKTNRRMQTSE